ncbi:MAG: LysM peptidoglycan-binding domain-containing protein [Spirochaetaceae bacterium]|jgi:membrane-bound lytic murein transglycosylase D|nr:LysM peptidoglycan-binding domain-containing protein [Spirochaetaceae bacterium]
MKNALLLLAALTVPVLLTGAEELVNYQLDETEHLEIIPGEPITRPLRQVKYVQPYASKPHDEAPVLFTLTGLDEPLTRQYIEQYSTGGGRRWLTAIMERSEPYLAFIQKEIERRGLPQELIYLPVIESAYSVTAVSRSGATGLWQFMRNSIKPYDMKITDWMDERRDFWKSTLGALDKLEAEYKRVGNWELTLSAYNAGLGTVLNAMKKYPGEDYWELCKRRVFKKETIHYIPKLLAVSYILSNPRRHGIEPVWAEDPQWIRIAVGRSVDLNMVAEYAGLPGTELKKANRELFYGITPPDPNYHIKVPAAQASAVASVLENPELTLIKYYFHTIRSGDTLSGIASRYGVSESQIRSHNPGLRDRYLKIGVRLIIPALKEINTAAAAGPRIENVSFSGTHLVKRGESLWSIALAYNTDPETLARINNMGLNDTLREGSTLKTPVSR